MTGLSTGLIRSPGDGKQGWPSLQRALKPASSLEARSVFPRHGRGLFLRWVGGRGYCRRLLLQTALPLTTWALSSFKPGDAGLKTRGASTLSEKSWCQSQAQTQPGSVPQMQVRLQLEKHSWKSSLGWAAFDQEALFILQYKHGRDLFSKGVASRASRYACPGLQGWEGGRGHAGGHLVC